MIEVTRISHDRLTTEEKQALSAASAPAFGRHPFDAAVEKFANNLLKHCSELHAAGKPIGDFLAKAPEAIR